MSTPTSGDGKPPTPSRDLRDSAWFKVAALLAVLAAALLATRSCARDDRIDQNEAIEIAKREIDFVPDDAQVRYVQRGIPPQGFWAVSLYTVDARGEPKRVRVLLVNAETGDVSEAAARQRRM